VKWATVAKFYRESGNFGAVIEKGQMIVYSAFESLQGKLG
jgi:hypothetical protein